MVFRRLSEDKMQFACLPFVIAVLFSSRSGSVFSFSMESLIAMHCTSNVDCKFGRTEGSRSGVHDEFVHAVLFG